MDIIYLLTGIDIELKYSPIIHLSELGEVFFVDFIGEDRF